MHDQRLRCEAKFAGSSGPAEPRLSGGRARERARGTGHPLQPLVGPARSAGTDSGWEDAAPLARREASAPTINGQSV